LWILHTGYGWLALGLLLRAFAGFDPSVPASLATHALTVGAIGSLTLGMMARVSLGHTGRALVASRPTVWAFGAITAAAFARAILPLLGARLVLHRRSSRVRASGRWPSFSTWSRTSQFS
jgi:uncharacterized protein involved in response to NO